MHFSRVSRALAACALLVSASVVAACGIKTNPDFQRQANHTDVQTADGSSKRNYDLILPMMQRCYTNPAPQFDEKSGIGEISVSALAYAGIVLVLRIEPEGANTKITTYSMYPLWRATHAAVSLWVRGDKQTCPINLL